MKRFLLTFLAATILFSPTARAVTDPSFESIDSVFYVPDAVDCGSYNGGTATGAPTSAEQIEREKYVWHFFMSVNLSPVQAAAFMGNMNNEAHFEPRLVEYGPPWLNSRGEISKQGTPSSLDDAMPPNQNDKGQPGYGIIQWTSPGRKTGLQDFATRTGGKISDLGTQIGYLWYEVNHGYKSSTLDPILAIKGTSETDIRAATEIVTRHYETPGDIEKAIDDRTGQAIRFLGLYGSDTTKLPEGSIPKLPDTPTPDATASATATTVTTPDGCSTTPSTKSGAIVAKAMTYAWEDGSHGLDPKPAYGAAVAAHPGVPYAGADCGSFVGIVMRDSGADPDYPLVGTYDQEPYVRKSSKYTVIDNAEVKDLLPGDILIVNAPTGGQGASGHTIIFIGKQPNGHNTADASYQTRMANQSTISTLVDYSGRGHFLIARLK
jgi:hypothetical protein